MYVQPNSDVIVGASDDKGFFVSDRWGNYIFKIKINLYNVSRYATHRSEPPIDNDSQVSESLAMSRDGMMMMQFMRPYVSDDQQVSA